MTDHVALVRGGYEAYARQDVAAILGMLDPECEAWQTEELPWGGVHRGHAGAGNFFKLIGDHIEALPEPTTFIPAGNEVAVVGRLRGRARASGKPIDVDIVHVWTFRNGRVIRFAAYIDTPKMLAALGEESAAG